MKQLNFVSWDILLFQNYFLWGFECLKFPLVTYKSQEEISPSWFRQSFLFLCCSKTHVVVTPPNFSESNNLTFQGNHTLDWRSLCRKCFDSQHLHGSSLFATIRNRNVVSRKEHSVIAATKRSTENRKNKVQLDNRSCCWLTGETWKALHILSMHLSERKPQWLLSFSKEGHSSRLQLVP